MRDEEAITLVERFRDTEGEQTALGDVIAHPTQAPHYVEAGYLPHHFADFKNRRIWRAIMAIAADGGAPDFPTVWQALRANGHADEIGASYVTGLVDGVPRQPIENVVSRRARLATLARCREAHYRGIAFRTRLAEDPAGINNGLLAAHLSELEELQRGDAGRVAPLQNDAEILMMPAPSYLIAGILPERSLGCLYSPPGEGKTFACIHAAMTVATGRSFFGAAIERPGPVVYVAGEGAPGLRDRVEAWKIAHEYALDEPVGVSFWSGAVQLLDQAAVAEFIAHVKPLSPRLVVLDTLARCMVGGDENSARDMGLTLASADRIRVALDAAVLLVHHQNKAGGTERGSSALRGACDVMLQLSRTDDVIRLESSKMKDAEPFEPIDLKLVPAFPGASSCVLRRASEIRDTGELTDSQGKFMHVMTALFAETGASAKELEDALQGMPRATFYRSRAALAEKRLIEERAKRWYLTGRKPVSRGLSGSLTDNAGLSQGVA